VKKQYAIKQKDGKLVSITVDGTEYDSVDAIPDPDDPAQPRNARIDSPANTFNYWIIAIITAVLGLAFAGATALALWIGK
jgi:hypothetical protein